MLTVVCAPCAGPGYRSLTPTHRPYWPQSLAAEASHHPGCSRSSLECSEDLTLVNGIDHRYWPKYLPVSIGWANPNKCTIDPGSASSFLETMESFPSGSITRIIHRVISVLLTKVVPLQKLKWQANWNSVPGDAPSWAEVSHVELVPHPVGEGGWKWASPKLFGVWVEGQFADVYYFFNAHKLYCSV